MRIEDLLDKYFEGETSAEEERKLRAYFTSGRVAEELKVYIPLFTYFEEEIRKEETQGTTLLQKSGRPRSFYLLRGIAASLLILLIAGIGRWVTTETDPCLCVGDYVVINGKCYTDPETVRNYALDALQEVADPRELSDLFNEEF